MYDESRRTAFEVLASQLRGWERVPQATVMAEGCLHYQEPGGAPAVARQGHWRVVYEDTGEVVGVPSQKATVLE